MTYEHISDLLFQLKMIKKKQQKIENDKKRQFKLYFKCDNFLVKKILFLIKSKAIATVS